MRVDLLQGTLDMLILKALSWGSLHGYGIVSWLEQQTASAIVVEEGSLYPALHRLAQRGWVSAQRSSACALSAAIPIRWAGATWWSAMFPIPTS
jgi:DNA-binding PadR family transcriptional regulator